MGNSNTRIPWRKTVAAGRNRTISFHRNITAIVPQTATFLHGNGATSCSRTIAPPNAFGLYRKCCTEASLKSR